MRRRAFLSVVGWAALCPTALAVETGKKRPTIGFLGSTNPTIWSTFADAFVQRLREHGWIDGYNVSIQYRWAEGREDRYGELATQLVNSKVDVIVTGGTAAIMATKLATSEIPIIFASAGDPVGTGLVASLAHPGGNVTGLSNQQTDLAGYRLELLHEVVPGMHRVALLGNVASPNVVLEMKAAQAAAARLDLESLRLEVRKADEIVPTLESIAGRADGLYVCTDPLLTLDQVRINTLALKQGLPTIHAFRQYVEAGALMSYGPDFPDLFRRAADFVDKILHGAKPADLPVEQPVTFDLFVNLTTAKALGLKIP